MERREENREYRDFRMTVNESFDINLIINPDFLGENQDLNNFSQVTGVLLRNYGSIIHLHSGGVFEFDNEEESEELDKNESELDTYPFTKKVIVHDEEETVKEKIGHPSIDLVDIKYRSPFSSKFLSIGTLWSYDDINLKNFGVLEVYYGIIPNLY